MTPPKFGSKVELWREWQEHVRGYLDATKPGIKEVLQALKNEEQEEGLEFVQQEHAHMMGERCSSMESNEAPHGVWL